MSAKRISAMAIAALPLVWGLSACASESHQVKVREPLRLPSSVAPSAQQYVSQGSNAFQAGRYDEAKTLFTQAVSEAPNSGEAHYNLGLVLFKLGDADAAREQFMQAANLAPGNKVIWDSPALSPYSHPDSNIPKKEPASPYRGAARSPGGGGPR